MLHGDAGALLELLHERPRGVRVGVVVEAHGLAREDLRVEDGPALAAEAVERGGLVRVLAVAQLVRAGEFERGAPGQVHGVPGEVRGDGRVVRAGVREGLAGERAPLVQVEVSLQSAGVVGGVHEDDHAGEVLRGRAQHGGPADVDVLQGLGLGHAARDRLAEGVEVDAHEVDGVDAVRGELREVPLVAPREDAAVNAGMQRLDAAVEDLGEAGDVADGGGVQARLAQGGEGAAGGDEVPAPLGEASREVDDAGLVADAQECAHVAP